MVMPYIRVTRKADRTSTDGIAFASKGEMLRWEELRLLERSGAIRELSRQPQYTLVLPDGEAVKINGKVCHYTGDFLYWDVAIGDWVCEEYKGVWTREAQLRTALFRALYPHIHFVVSGPAKQPRSKRAQWENCVA